MNKANTKFVKETFDQYGEFHFSLIWKKNRTWGHTCGLYRGDRKLDVASGYGYAKDTAMIESALYACTGIPISLGGNSLKYLHGERAKQFEPFELICNYEGQIESSYTFKKKTQNA